MEVYELVNSGDGIGGSSCLLMLYERQYSTHTGAVSKYWERSPWPEPDFGVLISAICDRPEPTLETETDIPPQRRRGTEETQRFHRQPDSAFPQRLCISAGGYQLPLS